MVEELAQFIARVHPGLRGFTRANLFRMRQFYEAYIGWKRKSRHWCDNCPGLTVSSFLGRLSGRKNESFICAWLLQKRGAQR